MSSGSLLTAFQDFDKSTTTANISQRQFVLDSTKKRRYLWGRFANGEAASMKYVDAGKSITFNTVLSPRSTYGTYKSGQSGSPTNTNHLVKGENHWAFNRANKMYEDAEILLNEGIKYGMRAGDKSIVMEQFAKVRDLKNAYLYQDMIDGVEEQLWAQPDKTLHEKGDVTTGVPAPMPIMAMVNEDTDGLFGTNWTGNTWTTKQDLDPTTAAYGSNYKPNQQSYNNSAYGAKGHLFTAFDEMAKDIDWEQPTTMNEYWENPVLNKQMIVTSRNGHSDVQRTLAANQNHYAFGAQDASYPDPQYYGVPITWNDSFGAGSYYDDGSNGLGTESTATTKGARFLWLNGNYICPVIHPSRFFDHDEPQREGTTRPDVWVTWVSLWYQNVWTSIRRHGIVYPSTSITGY